MFYLHWHVRQQLLSTESRHYDGAQSAALAKQVRIMAVRIMAGWLRCARAPHRHGKVMSSVSSSSVSEDSDIDEEEDEWDGAPRLSTTEEGLGTTDLEDILRSVLCAAVHVRAAASPLRTSIVYPMTQYSGRES